MNQPFRRGIVFLRSSCKYFAIECGPLPTVFYKSLVGDGDLVCMIAHDWSMCCFTAHYAVVRCDRRETWWR